MREIVGSILVLIKPNDYKIGIHFFSANCTHVIKKQDRSIVGSEYIVLYVSNCISGIKVRVLASNAVDRGCEPQSGQTKVYKMVFVASPLSTGHSGERAKTGWLRIRIICPSRATCLSEDCYVIELAL